MNIIVGENETGKTTVLEAINLVMSGLIDRRYVQYELNPYLFNRPTKRGHDPGTVPVCAGGVSAVVRARVSESAADSAGEWDA